MTTDDVNNGLNNANDAAIEDRQAPQVAPKGHQNVEELKYQRYGTDMDDTQFCKGQERGWNNCLDYLASQGHLTPQPLPEDRREDSDIEIIRHKLENGLEVGGLTLENAVKETMKALPKTPLSEGE